MERDEWKNLGLANVENKEKKQAQEERLKD
jgi:hypothetical protein